MNNLPPDDIYFGQTPAMQTIRQNPAYRRLPIIALTASVMSEQIERCLKAGMDEVMCKPLRLNVLATRLRHWLGDGAVRVQAPPGRGGPAASDIAQVRGQLVTLFAQGADDAYRDYVELVEGELRRLGTIVRTADPESLREVAHALHGMAAFFGADRLIASAASVQLAVSPEDVVARAYELESYLRSFVTALKTRQPDMADSC